MSPPSASLSFICFWHSSHISSSSLHSFLHVVEVVPLCAQGPNMLFSHHHCNPGNTGQDHLHDFLLRKKSASFRASTIKRMTFFSIILSPSLARLRSQRIKGAIGSNGHTFFIFGCRPIKSDRCIKSSSNHKITRLGGFRHHRTTKKS